MKEIKKQECVYCNEVKDVVEWDEANTKEWVCFDCRLSFLERDFGIN